MLKPHFPVLLLLLLISPPPYPAAGAGYVLCNGNHYTAGDPFAISLAFVFSDLIASGSARAGQDYYNISPYPNAFAYGHALCSGNLAAGDCSDCLRSAVGVVNVTCHTAIGGRASLGECGVRYEQYPFVG
ncbi:cysteine-rich repeat secretory protein 2-like [Phalaenopsis equestris]|uniref:cysteine-rich repeat secretory protein 2-like n=1 Tax=Phalaenopsis equestris TaxID=78828 RepID=UPI0009E27D69|nr:cysteine-rich repeat secretory protein 2-like [Phalaenopsis equestris]